MNRGRFTGCAGAAVAVVCYCSPALAKDDPRPSLSIDPIVARNMLAPIEDSRNLNPAYRLGPGSQFASGQRARLSIDVGDATLFAIGGKLNRQAAPTGPLDAGHARAIGQRRDSGKVYGAGIARSLHGVDLSATYQYSKLSAEQPQPDSQLRDDGPGKSHSLRAAVRIRFRP